MDEAPIGTIAARCSYWLLDTSTMDIIASHLRAPATQGATIAESLLGMIRHELGCSEEEGLSIMQKRLPMLETSDDFTSEFLKLDLALECLSKGDEGEAVQTQKKAVSRKAAYESFAKEYGAAKADFEKRNPKPPVARAKASAASERQSKKRRAVADNPRPASMPAEFSSLEQSYVKTFLPDGAYIWKHRHAGVWVCKLAPFGERRTRRGEADQEGLRRIITAVWKQWCELSGTALEQCPMHNLPWAALDD